MALAERAELVARLSLKDDFSRALGGATRKLQGFDRATANTQRSLGTLGRNVQTAVVGGVAFLGSQVFLGAQSLIRLEEEMAQTGAVIKSTGGIAGVTAQQVRDLAEQYEGLNATIDDKVIQSTENLLLTFTDIRKEAFEPTLRAVLDMNTALGGGEEGLQGTAIQVGKALQDPIRGLTALRRVGVNFTKEQEKQIKALVEAGDTMEAQKVILAELNREFGGSFLAQGGTTAGKVAKFRDAIEDLQKSLATALLPTIGSVADKLSTFLSKPETIAAVGKFGQKLADAFEDIDWTAIADGLRTTGQVAGAIVDTFLKLPPDIQKLAIAALAINKVGGGIVTSGIKDIAGLLLRNLTTVNAAHVTVVGGTVTGGGLPGVGGAPAGGGGSAIGTIARMVIPAAVAGLAFSIATRLSEQTNPDKSITLTEAARQASGRRGFAGPFTSPAVERAVATASHNEVEATRRATEATNRVYDAIERQRALSVTVNVNTQVTARSVHAATFSSRSYTSSFLNKPL